MFVPVIFTVTVGVAFAMVAVVAFPPLLLSYAVVAATVTVHPTYFPTQLLSVIVYLLLVAPFIFVPLVAVLLVLYHH